ncbi:unnamed protein product [Ranitomeya imitator]|uniref:Reverse transcriptase domain-containing protein n=1 Tax=Ranitomeya imitator TaxID=111125 RepID=A0ABN9L0G7_9NEOB|nr:unnamed protein product [Ranitomeya imitator]
MKTNAHASPMLKIGKHDACVVLRQHRCVQSRKCERSLKPIENKQFTAIIFQNGALVFQMNLIKLEKCGWCCYLHSKISIFADDTKLCKAVNTREDSILLQMDLDKLETWAERWQMRFNNDK